MSRRSLRLHHKKAIAAQMVQGRIHAGPVPEPAPPPPDPDPVDITVVSITNASGSTKTNEIVSFGLPLSATALGSNYIAVYDDNGSGAQGSLLDNFQIDNSATDLNGKTRFAQVTGIVPSLAGNATRRLYVNTSASPPPSGTAISAANILATSYECKVSYTISGTTYSASATTALGGSGTWGITTACTHGTWRSGPCCTEIICSTPLQNAGTAHNSGNGLRAWFHISAFKATTGAVGGGNPITYIRTRCIVENGAIDRSSTDVSDYVASAVKIERATSLVDSTLIKTTDTDVDGNTITYDFTSGYTHWYGGRFSRLVHVGTKPTNMFAYGVHASAITALTTDHRDYISVTSKMIPNYQAAVSDISHTSGVAKLDSTGTTQPFKTSSGRMGEISLDQNATGERGDLGVIAAWTIAGLTKWDANGRRRIFENDEYKNSYRNGSLRRYGTPSTSQAGGYNRPDDTNYKLNSAHTGTLINRPASSAHPWIVDLAHNPDPGTISYILTGDCYWAETLTWHYSSWVSPNWGSGTPYGTGINHTVYGDAAATTIWNSNGFTDTQERGIAWAMRSMVAWALLTPDAKTDDKIVINKTTAQSVATHAWSAAIGKANANTGSSPPATHRWATDGPRWVGYNVSGGVSFAYAPWQGSYHRLSMGWAYECGMVDSNGVSFYNWLAVQDLGYLNSTDVVPDFIGTTYWLYGRDETTGTTLYKTWADIYARNIRNLSDGNGGITRRIGTGTLTLSATSGTGVSVTLPSAMLGQTTYYVGSYIKGLTAGRGKITAVADASHCTIDVTTTFSGTSLASGNWTLGGPHPSDVTSVGALTVTTGSNDYTGNENYLDAHRASAAMMIDAGITGTQAVYDWYNNWHPGASSDDTRLKYHVVPR